MISIFMSEFNKTVIQNSSIILNYLYFSSDEDVDHQIWTGLKEFVCFSWFCRNWETLKFSRRLLNHATYEHKTVRISDLYFVSQFSAHKSGNTPRGTFYQSIIVVIWLLVVSWLLFGYHHFIARQRVVIPLSKNRHPPLQKLSQNPQIEN